MLEWRSMIRCCWRIAGFGLIGEKSRGGRPMTRLYRSEAIAAIHETMALHQVGAIDQLAMLGFDEDCSSTGA